MFWSRATEFYLPVLQNDGSTFVCELCQKHGKDVSLISLVENSKSDAMSSQTELKTVSPDTKVSLHLPGREGKVCI